MIILRLKTNYIIAWSCSLLLLYLRSKEGEGRIFLYFSSFLSFIRNFRVSFTIFLLFLFFHRFRWRYLWILLISYNYVYNFWKKARNYSHEYSQAFKNDLVNNIKIEIKPVDLDTCDELKEYWQKTIYILFSARYAYQYA